VTLPETLLEAELAMKFNRAAIWQRIESYAAHRWTSRAVVWVAEGPGDWSPPLTPATIATVEKWTGEAWTADMLAPSPLGGYVLAGCGPYRFSGTAGAGVTVVPEAVFEAFRRLAEYMAARGEAGVLSERASAGTITVEKTRAASYAARAMQLSGAGDLLRPFRSAP
jgi:hypothetical protein